MSSSSIDRPGFRLRFACSAITLDRSDRAGELRVLNPDAPDLLQDLREVAAEIAECRGLLTVELPASEVWRGPVPGLGRLRRRNAARKQMAARLGLPPADLALRIGRRDADGATPVAAVACATVTETRRFLAQAGLRADRIIGAGTFAGFAAAPDFAAKDRPALRRIGPASAGAALAAAFALAVLHPVMERESVQSVELPAVASEPAVVVATAAQEPNPARPLPRPETLAILATVPDVAPAAPGPVPQAPRAPGAAREPALLPLVTVATRNFPVSTLSPRPQPDGTIRLAELTVARARLDDTRIDAPMQRPASATGVSPVEVAVRVALADPIAPAPSPSPSLRPLARPGSAAAAPASTIAPAAAPAKAAEPPQPATASSLPRPRPRPQAAASAALSQAITEAVVTASVAGPTTTFVTQAASTGLAAASLVAAGRPEPRRFTASSKPAPAKTVAAVAKPKPTAPRKVASLAPAPAKPARIQPKQVKVQPAPAKVQTKAAASTSGTAATQKVGFSRNSVSLIGVFGGGGDRHALVRLPNGKMQRVRPGDRLQGAKVAAIGKDTVQLTGGGRNAVLTMPN